MGSSSSKQLTYIPKTEYVYNLKITIKGDWCNISYDYIRKNKPYEFTFKLTSADNLKMELFTQTCLERTDCYNIAEYIFEEK